MAFKTDGFLSPVMAEFRRSVREVPTYQLWFAFADELNRLGWRMIDDHEISATEPRPLAISVLFIRAHQSFQAAIGLIENGMLADARVVLRSASEGAIALNAFAKDPDFPRQFDESHMFAQRKFGRIVLNSAAHRAQHTPEGLERIEVTLREIDAHEKAVGHKFREIIWANVATKHCPELYDLIYRALSQDGTHTNTMAIGRFVELDPAGGLSGVRVGPTTHDLVDVFRLACLCFLWAVDPFAKCQATQFVSQIASMHQQLLSLPQDEPSDVYIEARFEE